MSIEIDPANQLSFRRPLTEAIKETLIIRNPTQLPIAFKVKTTAPRQYCVRPNSGRVNPGEELEVQVQMQALTEDVPADFKCRDKFLVQSVAITYEREQLSPADLWPTIEREAKSQIREKKIRCVFLPPLEHAITQIKEEDEGPQPASPPSSYVQAEHLLPAPTVHAPASPVQIQQSSSTSHNARKPDFNSTTDVQVLKRELESAQRTIHNLQSSMEKLQQETGTLRQRKPESSSSSSGPTMTAVHLKQDQGYPVTYIAGAALISFIFAYLFF